MNKTRISDQIEISNPKVLDGCTGCGVCVMICPSEPGTIVIDKLLTV